jgi:glycosyltransferase involved in cell wall biosynthesis
MACGCPVVSTDVVDETGYLVGFDAFETADAITRIIGNEVLRRRLAEGCPAFSAVQLIVKEGVF